MNKVEMAKGFSGIKSLATDLKTLYFSTFCDEHHFPGGYNSHILIVEDDSGLLEAMVEFLEMLQFQVSSALCAEKAIEILEGNGNIDLIITDISMPGMDGIEFTKKILEKWTIPVFVMTGYKPEEQRDDAISAGATYFFGKPFKFEELFKKVQETLQLYN